MRYETIAWTYGKINQSRAYGNHEVSHSSASGWYVFDHGTRTVAGEGLGSLDNAIRLARRLSGHRLPNSRRKGVKYNYERKEFKPAS